MIDSGFSSPLEQVLWSLLGLVVLVLGLRVLLRFFTALYRMHKHLSGSAGLKVWLCFPFGPFLLPGSLTEEGLKHRAIGLRALLWMPALCVAVYLLGRRFS